MADIDVQVGGTVAFTNDDGPLIEELRRGLAFTLGAMGSPKTNFLQRRVQARRLGRRGAKKFSLCG